MEKESNNYEDYHQHPLVLVSDPEQVPRIWCSMCMQYPSDSCLMCVHKDCRFFLHKVCADAPSELTHPFHPNHPLLLSKISPNLGCVLCQFCYSPCEKFIYNCPCGLLFHIKCALYSFNIKLDLPPELNHKCHRKHPLFLKFDGPRHNCKICRNHLRPGFVYACSPCEFTIHIGCVSPLPTIEHETHPHPFDLLLRQVPFTCDACGIGGGHAAYTCGTCSIQVHKECISLPRFIRSKWHDHRLSHTYFLHREYFATLDCIICHNEVDTEYGSYCCKFCNDLFHKDCALKDERSYYVFSDDDEKPLDESLNSFTVVERNEAGEATVIEHCKHISGHRLMLSDKVSEYNNKCCDGCLLPILASFFHCSECDFVLHKVCAELPKEKQVWHHDCVGPLELISNTGFKCARCGFKSNAFGYRCKMNIYRRHGKCQETCVRCIIALTPGARTHPGHKHPLYFYPDYRGKCNACRDEDIKGLFRCKKCDFCLDVKCFSLPITVRLKCDEHRLSLTYHDNNSYSESHFCDTCEERRDPDPWFYHCAKCDTSVHVNCVIDPDFSFLRIGGNLSPYFDWRFHHSHPSFHHSHPLVVVKNMYYYPNCSLCGQPCLDIAVECKMPGCNFIVHIKCPQDRLAS